MNIQYKILFDRDRHNKTIQTKIEALKEFMTINHKEPYFCSIGFVGGGDIEKENTSFDVSTWVSDNFNYRYDLNNYIIKSFKGCRVFIVEGNNKPTELI